MISPAGPLLNKQVGISRCVFLDFGAMGYICSLFLRRGQNQGLKVPIVLFFS